MPEPSGTRQNLLLLRRWLLICSALALIISFAGLHAISTTANTVRTRTAAALIEAASARQSLVDADQAAIGNYRSGTVAVAGPGELYQRQVGAAGQSLARVAEVNQAGNSGSRILQVVEGLVAVYTGAIGQADAHYRPGPHELLGAAEVWNASRLLHMKDGALAQLDALRQVERSALHRQLSTVWMTWAVLPLWVIPFLALFVLLIFTQRCVFRQFQRIMNIPLIIATALLGVLIVGMAYSMASQREVHDTSNRLESLLTDWHNQTAAIDSAGQRALARLMLQRCERGVNCGRTVDGVLATLPQSKPLPTAKSQRHLQQEISVTTERLADADVVADLTVLIPAGVLCIAVLAAFGLQPRLDEYRYRSRQ